MALEGTIKDFGLPDIFQLIGLQKKTGLLTLKNDREQLVVTFESGMVVNADSAAKRIEDRLGSVLVKQGKVTPQKLEEALVTQKATLQRLGHVLVSQNYITARDLQEALHVQVSQLVFKVFRWRDGEYHFAPADTVDYDRENFQPMSADFILMEGIRMVDEWPIIEKKIPSMDIVFRPAVDTNLIEVSGGDDEHFDAKRAVSSKIRLSGEEERVFRRVDGVRTVQAIIDSTGMSDFDVCRVLFDLLNRNLITTAGKGALDRGESAVKAGVVSSTPGWAAAAVIAVLAVAGIVAQRHAPFAVVGIGAYVQGPYNRLLESVSRSRLERLDRAIVAYDLAAGTLPTTLEDVVQHGLVDRVYLHDPWARPYHYQANPDGGYTLNATDDRGKPVGALIERSLPRTR